MLEDNTQKNMPTTGPLIREKAKCMYDHLVGAGGAVNTNGEGPSNTLSDAGTSATVSFELTKDDLTTSISGPVSTM